MEHSVSVRNRSIVFAAKGQPRGQFLSVFQEAVTPDRQVVVDMSDATAFKGDDLEDLVKAHHWCEGAGGVMILAALPLEIEHILHLLSLDEFFNIIGQVDEATGVEPQDAGQGLPMTTMRMIQVQRDKLKQRHADKPADPEQEAAEMVQRVKLSLRYFAPTVDKIELLEFLRRQGPMPVDAKRVAKALNKDKEWAEEAIARLEGLRVLVRGSRGGARFSPGPEARAAIGDILDMWADQQNRPKMVEWLRVSAGQPADEPPPGF